MNLILLKRLKRSQLFLLDNGLALSVNNQCVLSHTARLM